MIGAPTAAAGADREVAPRLVGAAYLAGLAVGAAALALAGGVAYPPLAAHGDFAEQWAAARVILDGGDPYSTATWRADAARIAGRASDAVAFVYPPYVTLALLPLALLPLPVAAALWVVGSVAAAALGLGALVSRARTHPLVAFSLGFALFASGPALLAIAQGQWDLVLLAATCAAVIGVSRGQRWIAAGAILLAKPQLAPLALLGLARVGDAAARRRLATSIAIGAVFVTLTMIRLDWWSEWWSGMTRFQAAQPIRTATIGTLFEPAGALAVVLVPAVIGLAITSAARARGQPALARWLAASVLLAPYVQAYDHLVLLAPLAIAAAAGRTGAICAGAGVAVLVIGDLAAASASFTASHDVAGAFVALVVWILVTVATSRTVYSPTNF